MSSDEEPLSEDNNLIEDILSLLEEDKTVRIEKPNLKTSNPPKKANQSLVPNDAPRNITNNESFEAIITNAEVILEEDLNSYGILNEEVIVGNEIEVGSEIPLGTSGSNAEAVNVSFNCEDLNEETDNPDDPDYGFSDSNVSDSSENEINSANRNYISSKDADPRVADNEANNSLVNNSCDNSKTKRNENRLCTEEAPSTSESAGKIKRNKRPCESSWDVVVNKKLRMTGQKYIGYKKIKVDGKVKIKRSEDKREERRIGPSCCSRVCRANVKRKCTEIKEDRIKIFNKFWPMTWKEKQIYIHAHVKKVETKQKTLKTENKKSRRAGTYKYYLSKPGGEPMPVCKVMFLNTLGLKEWMVQNWVDREVNSYKDGEGGENNEDIQHNTSVTERNRERKASQKKEVISDWLDSLAKVPSHYCRASSTKLYIEPLWATKVDLYRAFAEYCTTNNKLLGSLTTFMEVFEEKNLAIYQPKKDQCDTCYSFKAGNITQEIYNKHIQEKEAARSEKDRDKQSAEAGEIYCLIADVQSVKLSPMTKANAMYYKTKLCSHNYTVYNLANRHCTCFWFHEVEGDLSANTFASCLTYYLKENCLTPRLPIVVYTDGCTNQNRNQFMTNALLHFAVQNDIEITQKYLVKGHTQMEGDFVYARIEHKIKGKDVYVPHEYVKFTRDARENPFPYEALYLTYDFFKDFSNITYYDSVRPGKKKGDPW